MTERRVPITVVREFLTWLEEYIKAWSEAVERVVREEQAAKEEAERQRGSTPRRKR